MSLPLTRRIALPVLLVLAAAFTLTVGTTRADSHKETGIWPIAQNGFGERENSYAWSMGWFNGKLYVGTGRDVLCVENETNQYFVPLEKRYTTNPAVGVRCPADPYDMDLRAQIWQYTPKTDKWRMVFRAPTERNPFEKHKRVSSDIAFRDMHAFAPPGRRTALYAAGVSADEYLPPLLKSHPPQILRSYDGVHWTALHLPRVVVHYPGGSVRPMGFRSFVVWKNHLFVTATPDLTGDGALFEIRRPWSNHPGLVQVSPPNLDIFEVTTFNGNLYLGCGSASSGYSVWVTNELHRPFTPIVTGGAGRGREVTSVVSMHAYRGVLYVGASGWYQGTLPVSEMIAINRNGEWALVVGNPRKVAGGMMEYPISGLEDGFDSQFNAHFWRMAVQSGGMYVGTNSWSYSLRSFHSLTFLSDLLAGDQGFQLWATCDGEDFFRVTRDAFGHSEFNFGARTLQPDGPEGQDLYIGSANHSQGTMVVDDREPACSSMVNAPRRLAAPKAMIADTVPKGTLLSWKPERSAVRYEVLAAPEVAVTVYLQGPPTGPNGYPFEGATPTVTEPETPGSQPFTISLPGTFEPVGTTASPYFLSRRHGHYVYEVVARSASGEASQPSNVQIGPAPEPPATFAALKDTLSTTTAGGRGAHTARAGGRSHGLSLLQAARSAWQRGERSAALRYVRRLQAGGSGRDAEVAALATRLERRILYAGVAGGP